MRSAGALSVTSSKEKRLIRRMCTLYCLALASFTHTLTPIPPTAGPARKWLALRMPVLHTPSRLHNSRKQDRYENGLHCWHNRSINFQVAFPVRALDLLGILPDALLKNHSGLNGRVEVLGIIEERGADHFDGIVQQGVLMLQKVVLLFEQVKTLPQTDEDKVRVHSQHLEKEKSARAPFRKRVLGKGCG